MSEQLTENQKVEEWRKEQLKRAGYPAELASRLASSSKVDLNKAAQLIKKGCSPKTAARILL